MIRALLASRNSLITIILTVTAMTGFSLTAVSAQDKSNLCQGANLTFSEKANGENINCGTDASGNPVNNQGSLNNLLELIINVLSIVVAVVAVIMIIWGGLKFITSAGDSSKITSARNAIIYAIIGLIIVALAQFIVQFVLEKSAGTTAG